MASFLTLILLTATFFDNSCLIIKDIMIEDFYQIDNINELRIAIASPLVKVPPNFVLF